MELVSKMFWLLLAGGIGTVARYVITNMMHSPSGAGFPWGILAVNVVGSFLFGVIWAISEHWSGDMDQVRLILLVGFMGGFTTFASFAFDNARLLRNADWIQSAGNIFGQNVMAVVAVFAGIAFVRMIGLFLERMN